MKIGVKVVQQDCKLFRDLSVRRMQSIGSSGSIHKRNAAEVLSDDELSRSKLRNDLLRCQR